MIQDIRTTLTEEAEDDALPYFARNLKVLLLRPPFRGKSIMGIDPGLSQGCKVAVISETGEVLDTTKLYIINQDNLKKERNVNTLKRILLRHRSAAIVFKFFAH